MTRLQPTGGHILIQFPQAAPIFEKGILLPSSSSTSPLEATVIALGPGEIAALGHRIPFNVAVGDRILLGASTGVSLVLHDEPFTVVREEEILAVLETQTS